VWSWKKKPLLGGGLAKGVSGASKNKKGGGLFCQEIT